MSRDGRGRNASQSAHMILTCPSCATSYFTPDEAIGPGGRTVRCKDCKHTWRATLEEPLELSVSPPGLEPTAFVRREDAEPAETLAETPAPELPRAFRARAEQQRRLRRAATHGAVWAGIASGFAALAASAWLFRVEVVEMAPRAAAAYAAVGLTVNPTLVSGALRNVRDDERIAPPVRVSLLDRQGAEIGHAVVRIDAAPVLPGKVQGFAAVIPDPGARGQGVGVAFVLDERPAAVASRPAPPVAHRPLPAADTSGLRPALAVDVSAPLDMQPIDAVPLAASPAIDSQGPEAVSASHG